MDKTNQECLEIRAWTSFERWKKSWPKSITLILVKQGEQFKFNLWSTSISWSQRDLKIFGKKQIHLY